MRRSGEGRRWTWPAGRWCPMDRRQRLRRRPPPPSSRPLTEWRVKRRRRQWVTAEYRSRARPASLVPSAGHCRRLAAPRTDTDPENDRAVARSSLIVVPRPSGAPYGLTDKLLYAGRVQQTRTRRAQGRCGRTDIQLWSHSTSDITRWSERLSLFKSAEECESHYDHLAFAHDSVAFYCVTLGKTLQRYRCFKFEAISESFFEHLYSAQVVAKNK